MFFTQEDYKKIELYLRLNALKDTDFLNFEGNVDGKDIITFVHEEQNFKMSLQKLASVIGGNSGEFVNDGAFINMSYEDVNDDSLFQLTKYKSLAEAILNTPMKYRIPGGVVAWVSEKNVWQLHQFIGKSVEEWEDTTLWKNFNDTSKSGISFSSTVTQVKEDETLETTVECSTLDGGIANSIKICKDDVLIKQADAVSELTVNASIDNRTVLKAIVEQYSYTYTEEIVIPLILEAWIGAGTSYSDIITTDNKIITDGDIESDYNVVFNNTLNLYVVVPSNITLLPILLNGFEVPMQISQTLIGNKRYSIYASSNQYIAGTYTFVIGTYKGIEKDLILSMQQNIGGLQTLVDSLQEEIKKLGNNVTDKPNNHDDEYGGNDDSGKTDNDNIGGDKPREDTPDKPEEKPDISVDPVSVLP